MVYIMKIYVDGGCRNNGRSDAIGAAAAVIMNRWGWHTIWTRSLPDYPQPTNQRAELTAIIVALEQALQKYENLYSNPRLELLIYSDSRYAVQCMDEWIYKWARNGWINAAGREVANRDLIEEASDLDDRLSELGKVTYKWIPRSENTEADSAVNRKMDELEDYY